MSASTTRYSAPTIALHWITLILIAVVYATAELKGMVPKESPEAGLMRMLHSSCGLTILGLTAIRLIARLFSRAPAIVPEPAAWERLFAGLMHVALYVLLLALPLLAWYGISAVGGTPHVWGIALPTLTGENKELGRSVLGTHKLIANIGYGLIALHVLAALRHHYASKDNTLLRMLPVRG